MKIISGKYKGRKILVESTSDYRPTLTRIREDIFNLLLHNNDLNIDLNEVILCDLFAGTGSIGIETLLSLALELYHNDSLPLEKIIKCLTINPAKILKIDKGTLKKGADADICVFDLEKPWVVKAENLKSKSKNTAIENRKLQGKVKLTLLKGEVVFSI